MSQSLSNDVYSFLLKKILNNELVPGELINRRNIAEEMSVSVAPVLEAMVLLETEGFLESIPRKGTQIKLLKEEDIRGRLIVREAIECQAARMYNQSKLEENFDILKEMANKVDQSNKSTIEDWELEIGFHRKLVEFAECKMLLVEFDRIMRMYLFYSMNKLLTNVDQVKKDSHVKLLKKLRIEGVNEREELIRKHLIVGKERIFGIK